MNLGSSVGRAKAKKGTRYVQEDQSACQNIYLPM